MAIRTYNHITLEKGYSKFLAMLLQMRTRAQAYITQFTGGSGADQVLACRREFLGYSIEMTNLAAIPGLPAYAQSDSAENDPTYDLSAEWTAFKPLVDAVHQGIDTQFPKDAQGYWAFQIPNAQNGFDIRQFTDAQLLTTRTNLQAVIDQIEVVA